MLKDSVLIFFLRPLYDFGDKEPVYRKAALKQHLDNLAGKGEHGFSLQDFFKVLVILETITSILQLYMLNIPNLRSIDIRQVKLIIDDQCKDITSEGFTHALPQRMLLE